MQTPTYVAALPILHEGRGYEPGDVVAIDDAAAIAHLLESGALAPASPDEAAAPAGSDPSDDGAGVSGREGSGAAVSLPDLAEHLRDELAGPVARLAAVEGSLSSLSREAEGLAARLTVIERRLAALEGTAPPPVSLSAEVRAERIMAATRHLDDAGTRDGDDWTSAGLPTVAALERLTGLSDVTAAERDGAWKAAQPGRHG